MEDRWDKRYGATQEYIFGTEPNQFLESQVHHLPPGARVLTVAEGEGRNGVYLASRGYQIHGVEKSAAALVKARRLAQQRGVSVEFTQADLLSWSWPAAAYAGVVAIFIQFAGPADRDRIFAGIRHTLQPGGVLILLGYRPEQLAYGTGGPGVKENLYTEELLRQAFGDWEILTLTAYDQEIWEGTGHGGMSALIGMVARRNSP